MFAVLLTTPEAALAPASADLTFLSPNILSGHSFTFAVNLL